MITAWISEIVMVPIKGIVIGATAPPPDANAPNEVAKSAMPARPIMSSKLANTRATTKK